MRASPYTRDGQTVQFEGCIDLVMNSKGLQVLKVDVVLYIILLFFYRENANHKLDPYKKQIYKSRQKFSFNFCAVHRRLLIAL